MVVLLASQPVYCTVYVLLPISIMVVLLASHPVYCTVCVLLPMSIMVVLLASLCLRFSLLRPNIEVRLKNTEICTFQAYLEYSHANFTADHFWSTAHYISRVYTQIYRRPFLIYSTLYQSFIVNSILNQRYECTVC